MSQPDCPQSPQFLSIGVTIKAQEEKGLTEAHRELSNCQYHDSSQGQLQRQAGTRTQWPVLGPAGNPPPLFCYHVLPKASSPTFPVCICPFHLRSLQEEESEVKISLW